MSSDNDEPLWLVRTLEGFAPVTDLDKDIVGKWGVGSVVKAKLTKPRSGKQQRYYRGMLRVIWKNQDHYETPEALHIAIKHRFGMFSSFTLKATGETIVVYDSTDYDSMEQGDFNEFVDRTMKLVFEEIVPGMDANGMRLLLKMIDGMTR